MQGILGELHVLACEGGCKLVSKSQQAMTNYPLQEVKAPTHADGHVMHGHYSYSLERPC